MQGDCLKAEHLAYLAPLPAFYLVNNYLAPCLQRLSSLMNLSAEIAGITLLALGNGAPDFFTSLFASQSHPELILKSCINSTLVNLGVILPIVILRSKSGVTMQRSSLIRALLFHFISLMSQCIFYVLQRVYLWHSVLMIISYILYVSICLFLSRQRNDQTSKSLVLHEDELESLSLFISSVPWYKILASLVFELTTFQSYLKHDHSLCSYKKFLVPFFLTALSYFIFRHSLCLLALLLFPVSFLDHRSPVFTAFDFVTCLLWLYLLIQSFLSIIETKDPFYGVLLLAWGNTLGDFLTAFSVASKDAPLAVIACLASSLQNSLLTLGLGFAVSFQKEHGIALGIDYLVALLAYGLVLLCFRSKFTNFTASILLSVYTLTILTQILLLKSVGIGSLMW